MRENWATLGKSCVARWLALAILGWSRGLWGAPPSETESNSVAISSEQAKQEKETCIQNLKTIYKAIEAYQLEHKDLPNWLSDLVPQYLADPNVLTCPVCRRTGQTEGPPLADPKLPSSYLFEFCPVPLGVSAPNAPTRTRRDWKRRQMGLVGSSVPLVRCRQHSPALNLAFDGRVYESPAMWEQAFTNRVALADFSAAKLFAGDPAPASGKAGPRRFPPRPAGARKQLLDLSGFYNASLTESWHGRSSNTLASLPRGLQTVSGVEFDVRGIVQLGSKSESAAKYPAQVTGIKVEQKAHRLEFLHAAGFGNNTNEGQQVGVYVVHFAAQNMRLEIPIVYGHDVRNWHVQPEEPPAPPELKAAWTGENAVSKAAHTSIRLFLTTWTNVVPDVEIQSIDYVSRMGVVAPFLVGITAE